MTEVAARIEVRARRLVAEVAASLPAPAREALIRRVASLVEEEVARERARCVGVCLERAGLWKRTAAAQPASPRPAREEARFRHNEAACLADLLGCEPPSPADGEVIM